MLKITIIGLGQIGASIGLCLKGKPEITRIGHDMEYSIAQRAVKLGAIDKAEINLPNAVTGAGIVILALPAEQMQEVFEFIPPDLDEGALVIDTGPFKEFMVSLAQEKLPPNRHYVGLTPSLNPDHLHQDVRGLEAARPDLFQNSLVAIVAPQRTSPEAIEAASDLVSLMGATPLFVDPLEIDGLVAGTHLLPQVLAVALLDAVANRPGWEDGQRIAGRSFTETVGAIHHLTSYKSLMTSVVNNRENALRMIDRAITTLQEIREDLDENELDALEQKIESAFTSREAWWKQRQSGAHIDQGVRPMELPTASESFRSLFGFNFKPKDPKKK
jgi:prephenate dehydrogenase